MSIQATVDKIRGRGKANKKIAHTATHEFKDQAGMIAIRAKLSERRNERDNELGPRRRLVSGRSGKSITQRLVGLGKLGIYNRLVAGTGP
jgi:hypothetical protein